MLILALDTSSAAGSAAIVRDGVVAIERDGDAARTHGQRLPLELMTILRDAGHTLDEIDAFAVITGPGSFTGLRVGIATMQGLALARNKRVIPVSAFEAVISGLKAGAAYSATPNDVPSTPNGPASTPNDLASTANDVASSRNDLAAVWIDAHRREVFATLYTADGRTELEPPTALTPEATSERWLRTLEPGARIRFAGDGAVRYADVIRAQFGDRAMLPAGTPALAGTAGLIAAANPARAVAPHAIVPLYVRRSDAELARDRARSPQA